jgi:hypothetical protein
MKPAQPVDKIPSGGHKSPQSPKSKLLPALPSVKPPANVLKLINPDPGTKIMEATEQLVSEVLPAIQADYHLRQMFLRLTNLVKEGEGWAAHAERKLINDHIGLIVTHYFERKKVRRSHVEARHHIGAGKISIVLSVFHGRCEATRLLEIQIQ